MKVAVIGRGKTGQAVIDGLQPEEVAGVFSSDNPATVDGLAQADVAIIFVPAPVFEQTELFDILLAAKIPVVCATTGLVWSDEQKAKIEAAGVHWIVGHNFSLSMALISQCLQTLGKAAALIPDVSYQMREIHHVHKVDAPSGTAISWREWLGHDCEIEAIREGDVKGFHEVTMETPFESITLSHTAKSRDLFAQGAIWAAKQLLAKQPAPGMSQFNTWVTAE